MRSFITPILTAIAITLLAPVVSPDQAYACGCNGHDKNTPTAVDKTPVPEPTVTATPTTVRPDTDRFDLPATTNNGCNSPQMVEWMSEVFGASKVKGQCDLRDVPIRERLYGEQPIGKKAGGIIFSGQVVR